MLREKDTSEYSSAISKIEYEDEERVLIVTFKRNGAQYKHFDVPPNIWEDFCKDPSPGGYYNFVIKGNY